MSSASHQRCKVFFGDLDPQERPVIFAYVLGHGVSPHASYVFVTPGALEDLGKRTREVFTSVDSLDQADIAVFPHSYDAYVDEAPNAPTQLFADRAKAAGKPCVFFRPSDLPPPARVTYGTVFQEAIFASRRAPCERPHPAAVEDLLRGAPLQRRRKSARPVVSFRGNLGKGRLTEILKRFLMGREASLGAYTRRKAVDACRRSRAVDARIELVRFGGSEEEKIAQRELYVRSITESDYVLCMRGRGNWSYRFYETLSAGRVPVVVNTDMLLPLSDSVDWKRHCVWIELVDLSCLPEKILEFHTALDENAFERLQEDNRQLWLERLEPVAFWRETLRSLAV